MIQKVRNKIDTLIINNPFEEPKLHWKYVREEKMFHLVEGRRPAGYVVATEASKSFDDPGQFVEIDLVNRIRPRVKAWREKGYPGVTGITRRLLEHWNNIEERNNRFFFCQLEAMETLIWLVEAPAPERTGIDIPLDGGFFSRWCSKMATGTGKTVVMAMLIAWQVLNKETTRNDRRFSKNILIVAPGLTVKERLSVLKPGNENNYYQLFNIIPAGLMEKLRKGKIVIHNWHTLSWEKEEQVKKKRSVDKRGAKSDEAYTREVLGDMASARNILVINDEAHHAWRVPAESKVKGVKKEDIEESTIWVGGLDRIHKTRGILQCFDFSATPFAPSGKKSDEEALFGWIVSDFGLNDAIESGLVKTPRVVIKDNSKPVEYKSRLYHIYMDSEVKDDLNRKAKPTDTLPDLVRNAYIILGKDWHDTKLEWEKAGQKVPPVMISVVNTTETAARVENCFKQEEVRLALDDTPNLLEELCNENYILHIDSKVLKAAEEKEDTNGQVQQSSETETEEETETAKPKLSQKDRSELLRKTVDTVGKAGEPGEQIRNVISVGMLSEGWDAKTVTHIMGLRAFSSQLLCEQVVGRGLRRVSYDINEETGLFNAEYVNIFGVPFTFLPHEGGEDTPPPPPRPVTKIEAVKDKEMFEITWPNVIRIEHVYKPKLSIDLDHVPTLELDPYEAITNAELGAIISGKPSIMALTEIEIKTISERLRLQTFIFDTARKIFQNDKPNWKGNPDILLIQLIRIIEKVIMSGKITTKQKYFQNDENRKKILFILNMNKIVHHIWQAIRFDNTSKLEPVFDTQLPIRSTGDMPTWYTTKPCQFTDKSHVNFCVYDSSWEATEAYILDKHSNVIAWTKNDHLGFEIYYNYLGVIHKYKPDFLIKLRDGRILILEVKGQPDEQTKAKHAYLEEWIKAVNEHGGFGQWASAISYEAGEIEGILESYQISGQLLNA